MEDITQNSQKQSVSDKEKLTGEPIAVLPVKGTVVFPALVTSLLVTEARHTKLVDETLMAGKPLGLFTQKDAEIEYPGIDDIYKIGTAGHILKMLRFPNLLKLSLSGKQI